MAYRGIPDISLMKALEIKQRPNMRGDHAPRTGVPRQVYYGKSRISTGNSRGWNGIKSSCKANFEEEKLAFPTCRGSRPHKTTSGKVNLYAVLINNLFSTEPSWEEPEGKKRFSTKPVEAAIENQSPAVPSPKGGKNSKLHEYICREASVCGTQLT